MRHAIQFPPPRDTGTLAEWLRYAQVLSIDDIDQVKVWVPKGTRGARSLRPDLHCIEFDLPEDMQTFLDKLYQLGVIRGTPNEIIVPCPKCIGRPKVWQEQNIRRIASYGTVATPVTVYTA
jgi:hypothetical protein